MSTPHPFTGMSPLASTPMTAGSATRRGPPSVAGSVAVLLACFLTVFGASFASVTLRVALAVGVAAAAIVAIALALGRVLVGRFDRGRFDRDRPFRRIEVPGVGVVEYRLRRS